MTLTALEMTQQTAEPIVAKGSKFMFGEEAKAIAEAEGYPNGFALYFAGRAGVMGTADPDQVVSAFAWWEPGLVTKMFERGIDGHSPAEAAAHFAQACRQWGDNNLADVPGTETIARLGRKVIDAAVPMGAPLYRGWRALPPGDSTAGAAALVVQTLRELRGDLHIQAVAVEGLTPLQAVACHGGEERSKMFGWPEPGPDSAEVRARWDRAEEVTNQMVASYFEVLSGTERQELTEALQASPG